MFFSSCLSGFFFQLFDRRRVGDLLLLLLKVPGGAGRRRLLLRVLLSRSRPGGVDVPALADDAVVGAEVGVVPPVHAAADRLPAARAAADP